MKILKIFLLIIFSLLTILVSILLMLNMSLERTLLNIKHYENITQEFDIFTKIHENLDEELLPQEEVEGEEVDEEAEAMITIFKEVFDPQWLQSQVLTVLGDVLQYTRGDTEQLTATIDLGERKDLIEGKIVEIAMEQEDIPLDEAEEIAQQIADDLDFPETISLEEIVPEEAQQAVDTIVLIRRYSIIATIAILVIFLIFMLLLSTFSGGLKWFGASMLIPGLIFLIALVAFNSSLNIRLARTFVDIPEGFTFAIDVIKYTLRRMYIIPGAYSATGLALIILGSILGKKKATNKEKGVEKTGEIENEKETIQQKLDSQSLNK